MTDGNDEGATLGALVGSKLGLIDKVGFSLGALLSLGESDGTIDGTQGGISNKSQLNLTDFESHFSPSSPL